MLALLQIFVGQTYPNVWGYNVRLKETRSVTMDVFRFFFLFKSFVKIELRSLPIAITVTLNHQGR